MNDQKPNEGKEKNIYTAIALIWNALPLSCLCLLKLVPSVEIVAREKHCEWTKNEKRTEEGRRENAFFRLSPLSLLVFLTPLSIFIVHAPPSERLE